MITMFATCLAFIVLHGSLWSWKESRNYAHITSDGWGYYSYLPAFFIYDDYSFGFYQDLTQHYKGESEYQYFLNYTEGKLVVKYYCGEAILLTPFFLLAMLSSWMAGLPVDGFNVIFQYSVAVGALFYALLGVGFLFFYLCKKIAEPIAAITASLLFLATNLFYFAVYEPSASHTYSFALIAAFLYYTDKSITAPHRKNVLIVAVVFALVLITRPSNILVLFATPWMAGTWKQWWAWIKFILHPFQFLIAAIPLLAVVALQSYFYFQQTDRFWIDAYGDEHFYFHQPHFFQVLFGFRVGWFIYAPVLLFFLVGWWKMRHQWKETAFAWWLYFVVNVWLISCWHAWTYEGTFGMRPLIDHMPLLALPIAIGLSATIKWKRVLIYSLVLFFTVLLQLQTFQRHVAIMPWSMMDFDKYRFLFFNTKATYLYMFTEPRRNEYDPKTRIDSMVHINFEDRKENTVGEAFEGEKCAVLKEIQGVPVLVWPLSSNDIGRRPYIRIDWMTKMEEPKDNFSLLNFQYYTAKRDVITDHVRLLNAGPSYGKWRSNWTRMYYPPIAEKDTLFVWFDNYGGKLAWVDDVRITLGTAPPK